MAIEVLHPNSENASENLLKKAGQMLNNGFRKFGNGSILFLSSGGSSLPLLDFIEESSLSPLVTLTVLDERYSSDSSENNMEQISNTSFLQKAKNSGCKFIDTRVAGHETQDELSERFNTLLRKWVAENPKGKIIATTGVGPDGHISGIMPYPEDLEGFEKLFDDDEKWVVSYDAGDKNSYPKRVTTTLPFLRKIDFAVSYIVGDGKKEAVRALISEEGSIAATPARVLRELAGEVYLFTDQD